MKQSQVTFKDSIAAKLLKVVFGYYIIFALIVTLIQLGVEYYNVKDNVMKEVENLQTSFEGSLSEAIWTLNDAQLKSLLKGIWGNQVIVALRIDNYQKEKGDTQALEGWFIDRKGNYHIIDQEKEKSLPPMKEGAFSELILYEFPLKYIDEYKDAHDIGKAIFYSSSQVVIDRVKHGFILIVINSVIKTLALWLIFLFVARRLLIRPLVVLTQNVAQIDLEHLEQLDSSVKTIGDNELKVLELTFKALIRKLLITTDELKELNLNLEKEVETRTAKLITTNEQLKREITDRKKAVEALTKSEERFREMFEQSPFGIALIGSLTGRIYELNPRFAEISGRTVEEMVDTDWMSITHPDDVQEDLDNMALLNTGKITGFNMDKRYIRPDGSHVWINMTIAPVTAEDKTHPRHLCMIEDITTQKEAAEEKKQLQDKLQRAQKMEAMGLMAGGIAHDLNNILSGIVSYPELLLLDLPEDSPLREPIKTIQESGMRAADVVEDLLTIARGVATGKEVLNLNTVVEEYLDSAEHRKLERIHPLTTFKAELDSELLNITGSASHVKKVLMNLIVNASEAIEGKGTVTVSTMNRYLDEPLKGYEDVRIGEYVLLSISDDGSGISPQDLDRVFEPFYTKKVMGRSGTGLGLAVVWNSMLDHNGYINVKSSEKGTVFELYFPTTREEVAAEEEEIPVAEYQGHGEKILVVDDEERQREIANGILTRLGYNAETVSSGEEAIEYVKEHPVDLILLDMVMPKGINGRKTYEEIIKIRPGQKAIIASGYAKTKEVDRAQDLGAGKYIKKPYTLGKVGLAVKEELEK